MRTRFSWEDKRQVLLIPYVGHAAKTMRSLENMCHTWAASALEVCSRQGAIQIYVYLYLINTSAMTEWQMCKWHTTHDISTNHVQNVLLSFTRPWQLHAVRHVTQRQRHERLTFHTRTPLIMQLKLWSHTSVHIKETFVCYLLDSRWSDRRETLHVNSVGHEHENSQGPMSTAHC